MFDPLTKEELIYQAWLYNVDVEDILSGLTCSGLLVSKLFILETLVRFDEIASQIL